MTLSSVNTAMPRPVISSGMPWLISGSTWYGRPASTMPRRPRSAIHASARLPSARMSALAWASSAKPAATASVASSSVTS